MLALYILGFTFKQLSLALLNYYLCFEMCLVHTDGQLYLKILMQLPSTSSDLDQSGATSIEKSNKSTASDRNFLDPSPPIQKRVLPTKTSVFRT